MSKSLRTLAKKKKDKSLTVSVSTVDAKKGKATLKLTFKKPK